MPNIAIVNGALGPEEKAVVPILDRGFLFGDSVYEVVRTRNGIPFLLEPHYERLIASAERIGMDLPFGVDKFREQVRRGLAAAGHAESYIRIVVTRGEGPPNINPRVAVGCNWVIIFRELPLPTAAEYEKGIHAAIPQICRNDPNALDPAIKSGNYLNNILALRDAQERGAEEALILNKEGNLAEATTANVFIVEDRAVVTPPHAEGILHGITRAYLLKMAREEGIEIREENIPLTRLLAATEVFVTSSTRDVLAVTRLEGRPVGTGGVGAVTRDLAQRFGQFTWAIHLAEKERWLL